ncbi:MAG: HlyD family efflux transporter periplasmic adaptor subunit [Gemmatimonadetes bacterium]|nr:HlyD family efflux transporter periplasmic adaptor subunit [Gemmatimonadota bacterium]NIR80796.1 HlyD family efflux transporter periplasmic adaptor subunit [Gemmatimonadota bacterium]NIT89616.1 HlyD family efflux transporter periplasmic adaptor subunit [Gemmatimonadota bacterium]NIU33396.1 HlyD family efflux transporter periplasmic adaptor subunit [Gemmatimonadota bacterium]NIU37688.1 HlyD family efflux transporter periplasmic adaptor subunit [Gemmatimonadota bacterium]
MFHATRTKPKKKKRILQGAAVVVVLVLITGALRTLKPAAPTVDAATVWVDTVQHGTMVRQVRGPGTLVPEQRRWITAVTAGRVEEILILPGSEVSGETVFLHMSNPDVEVQLLEARQQLSDAQARLVSLRSDLETQRLNQQGLVAQVRTQYLDAKRQYEINRSLHEKNTDLVARAELERTRESAEELETRLEIERQRLRVLASSVEEQLDAQRTQVQRLQAIVEFNEQRVASLDVRAGVNGVLAELPVEEGQWVTAGGTLARVVQPGRLKAEIRIPQTQAQDIAVGQVAHIDTRNDTIQGQVTRIDPAVQNGTVTIDVALPEELPRSARPDLSVDGTVVIERLDDVTYMGRPAYGQANSQVGIFKLVEGGEYAQRVTVLLGRSSVNEIEVREGLQQGDVVILSDMSQWDGFDRVRIDR